MIDLIRVNHLTIGTPKMTIIDNLDFVIQSNEFVSIEGPSGSGKSTILKYLAQLLSTNLQVSGQYIFNGKDVKDCNPIKLRQDISYCFQNPVLFADTVRENFEFVYDIHQQPFDARRCQEFLERVKLSPSYIDKSNSDLSGGERQRVALIRNLLFAPKVLLLDEVTSALDKTTRDIIWQFLEELKEEQDMTFIMISHSKDEQDKAERHIVLEGKSDTQAKSSDTEEGPSHE